MPKITISDLTPETQYLEIGSKSYIIKYFDDLSLQEQTIVESKHLRVREIQAKAADFAAGRGDEEVTAEEDAEHKRLIADIAALVLDAPDEEVRAMKNNIHAATVDAFFTLRELWSPASQVKTWAWKEHLSRSPELAAMLAGLTLGTSSQKSNTTSLAATRRNG